MSATDAARPPQPDRKDPTTWTPMGFTKHLGFERYNLHPDGGITVELQLGPQHLNAGGITHGGVLFSLLDSVMGGAVVATLHDGEWTATESMTTNFVRPATEGRLRARGWIERRGGFTAFVKGELADERGKIVAFATGVWAIRKG